MTEPTRVTDLPEKLMKDAVRVEERRGLVREAVAYADGLRQGADELKAALKADLVVRVSELLTRHTWKRDGKTLFVEACMFGTCSFKHTEEGILEPHYKHCPVGAATGTGPPDA